MIVIGDNSFVSSVNDPSDVSVNPLMVTGFPIDTSTDCPQPFGTKTGSAYCQNYCIDTCTSLNPNPIPYAAVNNSIDQTQNLENQVQAAINNLIVDQANLLSFAAATGYVFFSAPFNTPMAVMNAVQNLIQTQLPSYWSVSISFQVRKQSLRALNNATTK